MNTVKFNLFDNRQLSCVLIVNVTNAAELKRQLMSGTMQCAVIKPSLVTDLLPICIAANKALLAESHGKLVTKSVYTEILFNLSISKNISQSLLKFGLDVQDSEVLVVSFGDETELTNILSRIEGNVVEMDNLKKIACEKSIHKIYKISNQELNVSTLTNLIASKISTKDFVNY